MLDKLIYPEKWQTMVSTLAHYPAINLRRQYQRLVIKRWIVANGLAFLMQYICLMTSTLLPSYSLIWFASGTACAMLFLRHYRVWPGIGLGYFFTYYLVSHHLALSFVFATVLTVQAAVLTWITRKYINPSLVFYHAKRLLAFSVGSAVLTGITSFILAWYGSQSYMLWPSWWLANFNGVLIVSIAWVTTDTFYTYGGKSFAWHINWCKTSRWAFAIACVLNMGAYLNLPLYSHFPLITALQLLLCAGTLIGLFLSLRKVYDK